MKKGYLSLAAVVVIVAVVAAAAVITVELGLAFQSETDSTDIVRTGDYVRAYDQDGEMLTIQPVSYIQSQDKTTYQLADISQSEKGFMEVWTKDSGERGLQALVEFQEAGTWLFVETINLNIQKELRFVVLVKANAISSLSSNVTVITIGSDGAIAMVPPESSEAGDTIQGNWRLWGVGTPSNYTVKEADARNKIIVLVDRDYVMNYHYNVIKMSNDEGLTFELYTEAQKAGRRIDVVGTWRAWGSGVQITNSYILEDSDTLASYDTLVSVELYDHTDNTKGGGVAGQLSEKIPIRPGLYSISIDTKYKSEIRIDPSPYQGDNMKSNIVFILSDPPTP